MGQKIEHLSSYADVVHTTAKQVISRRRKNENVFKMSKDEKCTYKRAKIPLFIVKYANLWGFCCLSSQKSAPGRIARELPARSSLQSFTGLPVAHRRKGFWGCFFPVFFCKWREIRNYVGKQRIRSSETRMKLKL